MNNVQASMLRLAAATLRPWPSQVSVSREIAAPAERVWAMVADVTRMGEWSPENEAAKWLHGATGAQPGAKFRGTNRNGKKKWDTVATIGDVEPGRLLSFRVTAVGLKVAEWRYAFESTADRLPCDRDLRSTSAAGSRKCSASP